MKLASDIGFDAVDAGPLNYACFLEPMAILPINLNYTLNMGTSIGYKLVKAQKPDKRT